MRIAQVAPLYESVPPLAYGGTERVVSYLTEELVRQGHEVTLFASGDSVTRARLEPMTPRALRLDAGCVDQLAHHILMLERVGQAADEFDIIHFHIDYLHFPVSRLRRGAHVTTLHGRLDIPDLALLYEEFGEMPVISISDAQRAPIPGANWQGTVHHGLPLDLLRPAPEGGSEGRGDYLAFLGRISPEKRVDRAIEIAQRLGIELRIAAKVDRVDRDYFDAQIAPLLRLPGIHFLGEVGEREKGPLLAGARALLFPIDWPEPFGMVMIEAMACGTPTVAWRLGSAPEVLSSETGFLVESVEEAVDAVQRTAEFDRRRCREVFERRFSAARMARKYVAIYERLIREAAEGQIGKGARAGRIVIPAPVAPFHVGAPLDGVRAPSAPV